MPKWRRNETYGSFVDRCINSPEWRRQNEIVDDGSLPISFGDSLAEFLTEHLRKADLKRAKKRNADTKPE